MLQEFMLGFGAFALALPVAGILTVLLSLAVERVLDWLS